MVMGNTTLFSQRKNKHSGQQKVLNRYNSYLCSSHREALHSEDVVAMTQNHHLHRGHLHLHALHREAL